MKGTSAFFVVMLGIINGYSQTATNTGSLSTIESPSLTGSSPYALVAGGSKGIGYAIAAALARRGYNLILIIVPGTLAKMSSIIIRFLPRKWAVTLFYKVGK